MTERKSQKRTVNRRVHCSLDAMPEDLQATVEQMIIAREWPSDFGEHYSGFPRYCDVIQYCRARGYILTKSAVGRFAVRKQVTTLTKIKSDLRPYVLFCLADACEDFANLQTDLLEARLHPERMQHVVKQQAELELLAEQDIARIETILTDLRKLK